MKEPQTVSCLLSPLFAQKSGNTKWPLRYQKTEVRLKQSILIFNGVAYFIMMSCFYMTRLILIFMGRHEAQKAHNIVVLSFVLIYVFVLKSPSLS